MQGLCEAIYDSIILVVSSEPIHAIVHVLPKIPVVDPTDTIKPTIFEIVFGICILFIGILCANRSLYSNENDRNDTSHASHASDELLAFQYEIASLTDKIKIQMNCISAKNQQIEMLSKSLLDDSYRKSN